jgi:hypothetical protein
MKNVVIVPGWIERTLVREHMSIKDVLDYKKISNLLNKDDVNALVLLQSYAPFQSYYISNSDGSALLNAWKRKPSSNVPEELDSLVNSSTQLDKDHLKSLFRGQDSNGKSFEVIHGDHETLLLVLREGYFGDQDYEDQDINIIENIIRVLYGEFVPEEVAQTSIFKRYVVILGSKNL